MLRRASTRLCIAFCWVCPNIAEQRFSPLLQRGRATGSSTMDVQSRQCMKTAALRPVGCSRNCFTPPLAGASSKPTQPTPHARSPSKCIDCNVIMGTTVPGHHAYQHPCLQMHTSTRIHIYIQKICCMHIYIHTSACTTSLPSIRRGQRWGYAV